MNSEKSINLKSSTDLELVQELKKSNPNAFTVLYERYNTKLSNFAYYKLNDKDVVGDLVQTVFTSLWDNHQNINIPGTFESYIYTIVRNKIIDYFRRAQVSQRYQNNYQAFVGELVNDTDHLVRHKMLSGIIAQAITGLPKHLRIVIELRSNTSMARKDIAEKLGLTEAGVRSRITRALRILKRKIPIDNRHVNNQYRYL